MEAPIRHCGIAEAWPGNLKAKGSTMQRNKLQGELRQVWVCGKWVMGVEVSA